MARSHPGINSLTKYLKTGFPWKQEWDATNVLGEVYSYEEVKQAMAILKKTDPKLHRLLAYRWQTQRSRNDIASHLYLDPSTLKRGWDKAMHIITNYLVNKEVADLEIESPDPLYN